MERRSFLKQSTALCIPTLMSGSLISCKGETQSKAQIEDNQQMKLKISLAQWSLNRAFFSKQLDPNDFAKITATEYDIHAIEYVNQFYVDHATDESFWQLMKRKADDVGVNSLLIMVDDEGDLGDPNKAKRKQAAENHFKWVNAAKLLDCHSIRVNAFGEGTKEETRVALMDGMTQLLEYAAKENINVLIENHGLYSSDGAWVADIIKEVNMPNFGTLPDFGNWCLNEKWGSTKGNTCTEAYDRYQGLKDFLPYAKGVSAKSYAFDDEGNETLIDFKKMMAIVKESDFDGYVGIEYEGETLSEPDGIKATRRLINKYL